MDGRRHGGGRKAVREVRSLAGSGAAEPAADVPGAGRAARARGSLPAAAAAYAADAAAGVPGESRVEGIGKFL